MGIASVRWIQFALEERESLAKVNKNKSLNVFWNCNISSYSIGGTYYPKLIYNITYSIWTYYKDSIEQQLCTEFISNSNFTNNIGLLEVYTFGRYRTDS